MKKIIPFKHEISFKNHLSEITSISLEHNLHATSNNEITGEFIVSGDYKVTDTSFNTENFNFNIPFDITLDDHYIIDNVEIDIEDFYYEIVNSDTLIVNIEVKIDKLEEEPLIVPEPRKEEIIFEEGEEVMEPKEEVIDRCIEEEDINTIDASKEVKSLFGNMDDSTETYTTYKIYIVRETDTIESIMLNYNVSKEDLEVYNDLKDLKIGDKLIIPALINAKD